MSASPVIRHKPLPQKSFGFCERCGERSSTIYGVTVEALDTYCGEFICAPCVTPGSVELGARDDIFRAGAA